MKKPSKETRPHNIKLRVTDSEKKKIDKEARKAQLSASDLLRRLLGFPPARASK